MHYYKFNIADWYLHTAHLSIIEEAVYFRLINHYYNTEKPFDKNETQSLIRRLRLGSDVVTVDLILSEFFTLKDDNWIHSRCEKEIKDFKKKAKANKANGAKGGRPPKDKGLESNPEITQVVSENNPDITLTTNHKPLTTNQEPVIKDPWPDGLNSEAWDKWIAFRVKCKFKKYKTDATMKKIVTMGDKETQALIIDQSIDNEYQGLFPIKQSFKSQQPADNWDDDNWHKDLGM